MNIQATLAQLNANITVRFETHGLAASGLQWLETNNFAAIDDSVYGKGVLIKFTSGKLVVFHNRLVMSPELQTELGLSRYIPAMDLGIFAVILAEVADIHKEGWVEAKTINALKTVLVATVEDIDNSTCGRANMDIDRTIRNMDLHGMQHRLYKESVATGGLWAIAAIVLVTCAILDAPEA